MDPTGLLDAVLAVAIYPGAAFLAVAGLLHRSVAGRKLALPGSRASFPPATLLPLLAATVAAAMLPLNGSPALRLPAPAGAAGNVVAITVLLAIAVDLGARSPRAAALSVAAAVAVLALAAAGGTVSVLAIVTASGSAAVAARALAAGLLVLAAAGTSGSRAASVVLASLALAAAALIIPAVLPDVTAPLSALASLAIVAFSGLVARLHDRWNVAALAVAGVAGALSGTVLALLSSRS